MMKVAFVPLILAALSSLASAADRPNFIVILTDDLGYGDLGCYGADDVATPNIDRMAKEGSKFTSFYVSPVCSPTRAALMTGCIPQRVGIGGVLFPRNSHGLNPEERTLPELLKEQGYATAIIGKWHLGNQDMFQPLNHGFDTWYGTPSSNSQGYDPKLKQYAENCVWREGYTRENILELEEAKCPLIRDNVVIEVPADQNLFTQRYTQEAIEFITEHQTQPFFLYLPHNMVHIPIHASEAFVGKSKRGIYGDAVEELDWSTGEILKTVKELDLDRKTVVIFTSDNGPNLGKGGKALPLSGGKGSTYEGGVRVPLLARWPGKIPAARETDEPIAIIDLLPTLVKLAGGEVPIDRQIDGKDIRPLLLGTEGSKSPHEAIYYMNGRSVEGIRVGDWKYRYATEKAGKDGGKKNDRRVQSQPREKHEALYHLRDDIGEQKNLIEARPEIAARLKEQMDRYTEEFKKHLRSPGQAE